MGQPIDPNTFALSLIKGADWTEVAELLFDQTYVFGNLPKTEASIEKLGTQVEAWSTCLDSDGPWDIVHMMGSQYQIVTKKVIPAGQELRGLRGFRATLTEEERDRVHKEDQLRLFGPAYLIDHMHPPNCQLIDDGTGTLVVKVTSKKYQLKMYSGAS